MNSNLIVPLKKLLLITQNYYRTITDNRIIILQDIENITRYHRNYYRKYYKSS